MKFRDLSRVEIDSNDLINIINELVGGTDRACAVIAAALLEATLSTVIKTQTICRDDPTHTDKLFHHPEAAFGAFHVKIDIAWAFGVIDNNLRDDLHLYRKIRNTFAHSPKALSFSNQLIASEISKLVLGQDMRQADLVSWGLVEAKTSMLNFIGKFLGCFARLTEVCCENVDGRMAVNRAIKIAKYSQLDFRASTFLEKKQ